VSASLQTERLILRPYTILDADGLYALVRMNEPALITAFPKLLAGTKTPPDTWEYIKLREKERAERITYAYGIWLSENKELVGHIMVKSIDHSVSKCELSYFISEQQKGKGLITEAMQVILDFCFDELHMQKIFLRIAPDNIPSLIVARKCKFEKEALLKNEFRTGDGRLIDLLYLGLTVSKYRSKN
jgi:ribosomal-protein-serine acetyltransferase